MFELSAKSRSDRLSKLLKPERLSFGTERTLLVFEYGSESGKTMVLDQMKCMEGNDYSSVEYDEFRKLIVSNVVYFMHTILDALPRLELTISLHLEPAASTLVSLPRIKHAITQDEANFLNILWHDPTIKEAAKRGQEFGLDPNAAYFLNSIDRIAGPNYRPTREDILRSRVGLTGVIEMSFFSRPSRYRICDMGPQFGDPVKRKYIHCFSDVQGIMFFVNLCDYDKDNVMEPSRLEKAMSLFESICNSFWLRDSDIFVFFTHANQFNEKLSISPLGHYFPDFKGRYDPIEARQYIQARFEQLDLRYSSRRRIFTHFISATDPPDNLNPLLASYFTPIWMATR
ncbi:guanine nucleotide binding protein, alpha subunit [Collybia nuda]|uniref:Guanine nucleotide binding protein, alpha subunit n=1 Tax=Collybia nuda TaxID=64659 RepID=A0A9P5Y7X2_9AGAR|nr:guanine nucleotide binding protein, alpha subunit [Collybia nuda]